MQPERVPLSHQYRHQWSGILAGLGVSSTALRNRHGPCPVCGGKDRFRYDDKGGLGTFFCTHCGAGDGPKLAMLFRGWQFPELLAHLQSGNRETSGAPPVAAALAEREETDEAKRQRMNRLWGKAMPITAMDPAGLYLTSRLGRFPTCLGLRFQPSCPYPKGDEYPAMLAVFIGPDGTPSGLHRTYVTADGRKAPVISPKLSLGPLVDGGAVRLAPPAERMGIAEGIETALAASILFNMPVWAALNANRLAVWQPPEGTREVLIFADNDASFTGQLAAFDLAARLEARGINATIETPVVENSDWADVLRLRR